MIMQSPQPLSFFYALLLCLPLLLVFTFISTTTTTFYTTTTTTTSATARRLPLTSPPFRGGKKISATATTSSVSRHKFTVLPSSPPPPSLVKNDDVDIFRQAGPDPSGSGATTDSTHTINSVSQHKFTILPSAFPPPTPRPPPPIHNDVDHHRVGSTTNSTHTINSVSHPEFTTLPSSPPPPPPLAVKSDSDDDVDSLRRASRVGPTTNSTHIANSTSHPEMTILPSSPPPLPPPPPPPSPPPPPIEDDPADDLDLLRRAAQAQPDPSGPTKKVAFLFLTTTPLPFAPLWELFFNHSGARGKYNIYIHADPAAVPNPRATFTGVFSGRVIPSSKPTRRNTPTLIAAARRLLAHALLDDPSNYIFTLLSGACIPIHSFNFTYHTLTDSNRSFIEILKDEPTAYARWAARGDHAMLPEVGFDIFRIGSQFWSLTRRHARLVVEDIKFWKKFRQPCVRAGACYPEENYFPTLLSVADPTGVVPATLTHVNWWGQSGGHPHMYNESEVGPGLIRWMRESRPRYGEAGIDGGDLFVKDRWDPFLFARKFAPACLKRLMAMAEDVLFKD